jgi:hypothetical protein
VSLILFFGYTAAAGGPATITGTGALAAQAATIAGTAERSITGSGALASSAAAIAGTGQIGAGITGSGALTSAAAAVSGTGTIIKKCTLTLRDEAGNLMASATGIKWAWFDEVLPTTLNAPTDQGTGATNGSGVMVIEISNSSLTNGGVGSVLISNSDGTTTQSPLPRAAWAPAEVD